MADIVKVGRFSMIDWFCAPFTEALRVVEKQATAEAARSALADKGWLTVAARRLRAGAAVMRANNGTTALTRVVPSVFLRQKYLELLHTSSM